MVRKHKTEAQIKDGFKLYKSGSRVYESRPKEFIARQVNGKWEITFTFLEEAGYELHVKRNEIKRFSNLTTVGKCLSRLGVNEFKVILEVQPE